MLWSRHSCKLQPSHAFGSNLQCHRTRARVVLECQHKAFGLKHVPEHWREWRGLPAMTLEYESTVAYYERPGHVQLRTVILSLQCMQRAGVRLGFRDPAIFTHG